VGKKKFTNGITKDLLPEIMALLKARAAFFAKSVNNTTLDKLVSTLTDGISDGESIPKLKNRVLEVYDEFPKYRANTIARTETNAVVNEANLKVYDEVKYVEGKEWIATLDDRVRDSHLMLDGEIVAKDKKFSNGLRYPGEAGGEANETINCRCAIAPVWNLKE
jgi:SPP1 gp7 family putative phage head morphogenesis protein